MSRSKMAIRTVKYSTLVHLKEYATEAYQATLDGRTDEELNGALEWVQRHDRTANSEDRFVFADQDGQQVDSETQIAWGKLYFSWLNSFRESVELELATRTMDRIFEGPKTFKPDTSDRRVVHHAVYSALMRMGRSRRFLSETLPTQHPDDLLKLYRYTMAMDRQGTQELVFVDADGQPQPASVQKLYGWRFFNYINRLQEAIQKVILKTLVDNGITIAD